MACVRELLPKIRSIKGISILKEKRLKRIDKLIKRVYKPM
jgi:hypothetical protein